MKSMGLYRPSVRGSRLASLLVLAMTLFVLPTAVLPALYHEIACHLHSPPDCITCLSTSSAATEPDTVETGHPLVPVHVILIVAIVETDTVLAGPHGGRSPPALG
jgi:hypothetical protein